MSFHRLLYLFVLFSFVFVYSAFFHPIVVFRVRLCVFICNRTDYVCDVLSLWGTGTLHMSLAPQTLLVSASVISHTDIFRLRLESVDITCALSVFCVCRSQYTYTITSYGIDSMDLLETDAFYPGTVYKYRIPQITSSTLADCAALAATGWASVLNWTVPSTPSAWCCSAAGITCAGTEIIRVTEVLLGQKGLTGTTESCLRAYVCLCVCVHGR